MAVKWKLTGHWINSCSCDSGCPCLFYSDPTQGYCASMDAFFIAKGKYGDLALDGLSGVYAGRAPGNFWKGNWTAAIYLDAKARTQQRQALETLFGGKAGGPLALMASLVGTLKGVKWVPIKFDVRNHSVAIPGIMQYQLKATQGGNKRKPIQVSNNPFAPAIDPMNMGVGVKSHYKDYGMEWDNTGKDGNWAPFTFSGP